MSELITKTILLFKQVYIFRLEFLPYSVHTLSISQKDNGQIYLQLASPNHNQHFCVACSNRNYQLIGIWRSLKAYSVVNLVVNKK